MSDEFKVQWSVSLPPAAQYAKGHMLNVRGTSVSEVEAQLDDILSGEFIDKATRAAELLVAAQTVQAAVQNSSPSQEQAPTGGGQFCPHGQMTHRSGTNARGPWQGYFCPLKQGDPNQCKPQFIR